MIIEDVCFIEEDEIIEVDSSLYCPIKKDIIKVLNNELKKSEYSRFYLHAKHKNVNEKMFKITPMACIKKNVYIFKLEDNKLKKFNIEDLEFQTK
ncbi:MAG: hypothetical protein RSE41_05075 [Clostridia bacterium]